MWAYNTNRETEKQRQSLTSQVPTWEYLLCAGRVDSHSRKSVIKGLENKHAMSKDFPVSFLSNALWEEGSEDRRVSVRVLSQTATYLDFIPHSRSSASISWTLKGWENTTGDLPFTLSETTRVPSTIHPRKCIITINIDCQLERKQNLLKYKVTSMTMRDYLHLCQPYPHGWGPDYIKRESQLSMTTGTMSWSAVLCCYCHDIITVMDCTP